MHKSQEKPKKSRYFQVMVGGGIAVEIEASGFFEEAVAFQQAHNVEIVSNEHGSVGAIHLWRMTVRICLFNRFVVHGRNQRTRQLKIAMEKNLFIRFFNFAVNAKANHAHRRMSNL